MNRLVRKNVGRNGHYYLLDKEYVPGVTTVLGSLDKPWMKPWVAGLIADYVADNRDWLAQAPTPDSIRRDLKALPNTIRDTALLRGTELHALAERLHRDGTLELDDGEQADMVRQVAQFLDRWEIEPVAVEVPVCNTRHRWAGTTDLLATCTPLARHLGLPDDTLCLFDYKTNKKAVYAESGIQVATYRQADLVHIAGVEQPMPDVGVTALIRVEPTLCELVVVWPQRYADLYRLFTAALHVWRCTDQKRGWVDTVLAPPAQTPDDLDLDPTKAA